MGAARSAALDRAFSKASSKARSGSEWLSLLKRGRQSESQGDRGRYASLARLALAKAGPGPELARAEADAFLRAGDPLAVLSLYQTRLSVEEGPRLWSEAFVEAMRLGILPPELATPANFGRLAELTGDGRLFLDAASRAMAGGDVLGARAWISRAGAQAVDIPPELLWDAQMYGSLADGFGTIADGPGSLAKGPSSLADGPGSRSSPAWLRLSADSAWLLGRRAEAIAAWKKAVELDPRGSYRTWASLAAASGEPVLPPEDGGIFDKQGQLGFGLNALKRPNANSDFHGYYGTMRSLFPKDAGASILYAGALARAGQQKAAATLLESTVATSDARMALDRLRAGRGAWVGNRLSIETLKAVDAYPQDPGLLDAGLSILLESGSYGDFVTLFRLGAERGLRPARRDLFAAYARLLEGDRTGAEESFRMASDSTPGPEADQALGLLAFDDKDFSEAATRLEQAFLLARDPAERSSILKSLGRLADRLGDLAFAHDRYLAASLADPSDAEAWRLAHR